MTKLTRLGTTTALVTLMATPALADVKADDVWDSLVAYHRALGLDVEATQNRANNTLSLSNIKISGDFPYELGSVAITTTGFKLIETGDGTVVVEMPDSLPLAIALSLHDDSFITANLDYKIATYNGLASGNPKNVTIDYSIDSLTLTLMDFNASDLPIGSIDGTYTVSEIAGTSNLVSGDMFSISQKSSISRMELGGGYTDPETRLTYRMSEVWNGMTQDTKLDLPTSGIDLLGLPAQLRSGLSLKYNSTAGSTIGKTMTTIDGQVVGDENFAASSSASSVWASQDGFTIDVTASGYDIDSLMPEIPFPIRAKIANIAAKIKLPLLSTPEDQEILYAISFDGLTMKEELWALFDPTGGLPRGPSSVKIDLSSKVKLFVDLLDIEAMREVIDENIKFGELTALTLNDIDITAIGAQLTGSGAFTFDNTDLDTFDGLPAPSGEASFHMAGLNALMDTLVEIGILDNDEAFGTRMGLSLFTVAGDREDMLVSDIKITPDGQITANGKRIK